MKFACEKCAAKYSIADDKVQGKLLRIRCKKCGNIIELKQREPAAPEHTASRSSSAPRPATHGVKTGSHSLPDQNFLDEELERAFGNVVGDPSAGAMGPPSEPDVPVDSDRTVLFDYSKGFIEGARAGDAPVGNAGAPYSAGRVAMPVAEPTPAPAPAPVEWYLAVDGQQTGPLSLAEMTERLRSGTVPETSFAWRDGMPDWLKIVDLPELRALLPPPPPPMAPAIIEATAVPSSNGISLIATPAPSAPSPAEPEIAAAPSPEPVQIAPAAPSRRIEVPPAFAETVAPRRKKFPVGLVIVILIALAIGVLVVLAALDIIYIPFLSSEPPSTSRRTAPVLEPATKQIPLRDPLLDRDAPRIVIERVPEKNGTHAAPKAAPRRSAAVAAPALVPAPPPTQAAVEKREAPPPAPNGLSELEKRVYNNEEGAARSPRLPEGLATKTNEVPLAAAKGLPDEVISNVIKKYRHGIQNCYDQQLKKDPSVKGKLTLKLQIGKSGRVNGAGVDDSMKHTDVGQCVARVAKTWRFPPSGDDVEIYYPVLLEKTPY
jgi:predicted Zn finger-like uncharacterized protein